MHYKIQNAVNSWQRTKHKKLVAAIVASLLMAIYLVARVPTEGRTPYEQFSLELQVVIGAILGFGLFWLQRLDNDQILEISERRKYFWANKAISELHTIMNFHSMVLSKYKNAAPIDLPGHHVILAYEIVRDYHIPSLSTAMTQIADLLVDPSIYDHITENNYRKFTQLLEGADVPNIQASQIIPQLEALIEQIEDLIERLKVELPKNPHHH